MSNAMSQYESLSLFIDGKMTAGDSGASSDVLNPSTNAVLAKLPHAKKPELDRALAAADKGFKTWKKVNSFERAKVLRKAADLMRARVDDIARVLTLEQGKPLMESKVEILAGADITDWFADEGRRAYGRIIPARADGVRNMVIMEPVGPVAGFSPWNFPVTQAVRKIAAALAAGCSIIVKCPEETPGSPLGIIRCFHDAGVPDGVLNLVYGVPAEISEYLIPSPIIRKVSFTGSVPVGKHLASLAAQHMKRTTMELGGHAPVLVFNDVDVDAVAKMMVATKTRNAGQVCVSPTRFFLQDKIYDKFVAEFTSGMKSTKVGDGMDPATADGPARQSAPHQRDADADPGRAGEGRQGPDRRQADRQPGQLSSSRPC